MKKAPMTKVIVISLLALGLSLSAAAVACQAHGETEAGPHPSEFMGFMAKSRLPGQDITLVIPKISCMACAYKIKKALKPVAGVQDIHVDAPTHTLKFKCDGCDLPEVRAKLQEIEYPANETS